MSNFVSKVKGLITTEGLHSARILTHIDSNVWQITYSRNPRYVLNDVKHHQE